MNSQTQNILPYAGEAYYYPDFFSPAESGLYLQHLVHDIPWKQEPIKLFGKTIMQPRLTAFYGDAQINYSYSGITMQAHAWTKELQELKMRVEKTAGIIFNGALLNLYRDGNDSMGWHRDNEKMLGKAPVIASLSFGSVRKFQLRDYSTKKNIYTLPLNDGSLLLMRGETQQGWEHRVPKSPTGTGLRVNITFRALK